MEDLKKLKQILVDYTYNNKVLLEIELNKISDKRLVVGLLVDILGKIEQYEADKAIITSTLLLFIDSNEIGDSQNSKIFEDHKFYQEEMKKVFSKSNASSITKCLELITILKNSIGDNDKIEPLEVPDFVKGIKECSQDDVNTLKKFLLDLEMYDVIVDIEKITNNTI